MHVSPTHVPHPSQADLVAVLTRCFHRDASVTDTAAAVRQLFSTPALSAEVPAAELEAQYVLLADQHGDMAELCRLNEYDPDKGRVPQHWKPLYMQFFASAVRFGIARGLRLQSAGPAVPGEDTQGTQVTMTGHQLQQALALTWPDGQVDPDQGFTVVTIATMPAGPSSNEDGQPVDMPTGLYLSFDDMPDEGMQQLVEIPDPRAPGATS